MNSLGDIAFLHETGHQHIPGASGCHFQSISGLAVSHPAHGIKAVNECMNRKTRPQH